MFPSDGCLLFNGDPQEGTDFVVCGFKGRRRTISDGIGDIFDKNGP